MTRKRLGITLLAIVGLAAWALWPEESGPRGPSISERVGQSGAPAGSVSGRVIPQDDLPPAGTRSLFDHLLAQNDGLPYPFERLVALVQSYDPAGSAAVATLIPFGRSLLKAQADFAHPRIVAAPDFQAPPTAAALGLAPRGQLFLALVEQANEIEVISYNEAAGRFEFQLVQDYRAGGVPRIVYARRAVCTTCHQGAAPIFPQRPWSETGATPAIAAAIGAARPGEERYFGVPHATALAAPERFDELTDIGNFIPVTQRLWLDGCGEAGSACRRQMLKLALRYLWNPGDFAPHGPEHGLLRQLQAEHWPEGGIAVPEADLRNRDPLAQGSGLRDVLRRLLMPEAPRQGSRSNEDLESFEQLPKLPAEVDPLAPRPPRRVLGAQDLDGAYGIAQLLSATDFELLEAAAGHEWQALERALDRLPESLFAPLPFGRVRTINALLVALGRKPRDYAFLDTSALSPPVALGVPPLALAATSPLKPFEQYCFACHRGNPAARLDFMAGATEAEVLERLKGRDGVRDALDWERYRGTQREAKLMPPADSLQRAALAAALQEDPQLLEEMRKVVPAMFDF